MEKKEKKKNIREGRGESRHYIVIGPGRQEKPGGWPLL